MTRQFLASLLMVSLLAAAGCTRNGSGESPDPAEPKPADAAAAAAAPLHSYGGLVDLPIVSQLRPAATYPVQGYPGKKFLLGAITDQATWDALQPMIRDESFPTIDWQTHAVVYAVLDAQTNALSFAGWRIDAGGIGTLLIDWSGIEPFYTDATPGVFAVVAKADIDQVRFVTTHPDRKGTVLGTIEM